MIPWAFAYERQNYASYLIPFLDDMRHFFRMPEVYTAFNKGNFSVQMGGRNPFGQNEADKTVEKTINRDCKTGGGYVGFSANFAATQRWVLTDTRRGVYNNNFFFFNNNKILLKLEIQEITLVSPRK